MMTSLPTRMSSEEVNTVMSKDGASYAFFIVNFPLKYIFTAYPYNLQVYGITKCHLLYVTQCHFVNTFFVKKAKNAKKSSLTCRKSGNPAKQLRETHFLLS